MAISLACDCGKKLTVKDDLAGKKVKCPNCGTILRVPEASAVSPGPSAEAPPEQEELPRPKKKKAVKKNNKMLYIAAGAGVLVLGFCCVGIAGGVGLFLWPGWLRGGPEKQMLGKWTIDIDAMKKNNSGFADMVKTAPAMEKEMQKMTFEFKSDGTMVFNTPQKNETGKWKNAVAKGDLVTIDTQGPHDTDWEKIEIKVIDSSHIQLTPTKDRSMGAFWLKRA
jgi:hypothetical protein